MPPEKEMRRLRDIVLVVLAAGLLACGTGSGSNLDLTAMERGDVLVKVENRHTEQVTLYGVKGAMKFRIGLIPGTSERAFWVRDGRYAGNTTVDYLLQPTGTRGDRVYTEMDRFPWGSYRFLMRGNPTISDSDVVSLRLMPELGHSYLRYIGR